MSKKHTETVVIAKGRLDRLIANARNQLLMPITIAESLHRITNGTVQAGDSDTIRRASYHWCAAITLKLFGKNLSLNRSYWDKLFSDHVPPASLAVLAKENSLGNGVVEAYVYARLRQTVGSLARIRDSITNASSAGFSLVEFLSSFEQDPKLRRSVDKAYEVVVHALFNAIATRVNAQVTISVSASETAILGDFQDFCRMLLGVDVEQPSRTVNAKLHRVGGANSRDGGVDLWANFGPAVQVKHIALDIDSVPPMVNSVSADQIVIVCRDAEKDVIDSVLKQVGLGERVRGIITKSDLVRWYGLALGPRHAAAMSAALFKSLLAEFDDEFALADPTAINAFAEERGYDRLTLDGVWSVDQPVVRVSKSKQATIAAHPDKPAVAAKAKKRKS
ncbi:MAG: HaeII family restriction endonuclease [Phycisphaeraceae bacterium]|nr:HaeII family restriction endonuclease [Phycisphaeraceae bacterium]MBX3367683.1 HaeII family restriction endonuclease [Phycisphaeraceae bacterium]